MMKVVALRAFNDLEAGIPRGEGDEWEVTEERFLSLNSSEFGKLVDKAAKTPEKGVKRSQKG